MNAYDFCKFFDFTLVNKAGTDGNGFHYNFIAFDDHGTFDERTGVYLNDFVDKFDSLLADYIDAEIEHDYALFGYEKPNAFNYDATKDGSYYEQAAEWVKTDEEYKGTILEDVLQVLAGYDRLEE